MNTSNSTPKWIQWSPIPSAIALILGIVRWSTQGDGKIWTTQERHFYLEQPLGWELSEQAWPWLGAEVLAVMTFLLFLSIAASQIAQRATKKEGFSLQKIGSIASGGLGVAGILFIGLVTSFFVAGLPPEGALGSQPALEEASADAKPGDFKDGVAGKYEILKHEKSHVVLSISAGGETFEGRLKDLSGSFTFDPSDVLAKDNVILLDVPVKTVDSENGPRDSHINKYFKSEEFPNLSLEKFQITKRLIEPSGDLVNFDGSATLKMMGATLEVPVKGQLRRLNSKQRTSLGIGDEATYILRGAFTVDMEKTPLKESVGDFDSPLVPVQVSLLLQLKNSK